MSEKDMIVEFKDILQKGISYMKNVEIIIDERINKLKEARDSLDRINKNLEQNLSNITKNGLSNITSFVNNYFNDVKPKIEKLSIAQNMITDTVKQLKADVKVFSIRNLMKKVVELENVDFSHPIIPQSDGKVTITPKTTVKKKVTLAAPIPSPSSSIPNPQLSLQEATVEETENTDDMLDSEIEGTKIYDTLITGWKRRDWEKLKGTREMFIWGWTKLSSFDRQKIKNGTWSKPIMNKVKMLGRERK